MSALAAGRRWCGAGLAALLLVAGCVREPADAAATWPEGTVLVVEGIPIKAAEVDEHLDAVRAIRPAISEEQLRRLVLMNQSLPRALAEAEGGPRRAEALEQARAWLAEYGAGERSFEGVPAVTGNWDLIGFDLWLAARHGAAEEVLGPLELPGRQALVLVEARGGSHRPELESFLLRVVEFPFVEAPDELPTRATGARIEVVDPAWRDILPGIYKY